MPRCIEILKRNPAQAFYEERHQAIYEAMLAVFKDGRDLDVVVLMDRLDSLGLTERAGGPLYLAELTKTAPTSANLETYCNIVKEHALLRNYVETQSMHIREALAGGSCSEILQSAEADMARLAKARLGSGVVKVSDSVDDVETAMIHQAQNRQWLTGLPTGITGLDQITGGLHPQQMIVLAARPSVGKTAFALRIASSVAAKGKRVLVFSLEMSKESLTRRLICAHGGVDDQALKHGRYPLYDMDKIREGARQVRELDIQIDDSIEPINELTMRAKARTVAMRGGLDLVVIDYLQLMAPLEVKNTSRETQVASISRAVKGLGRELNIPVLTLSQLSREAAKATGGAELHHLRESGAIEQDADVVMFLDRDKEVSPQIDHLRVRVAKQREGALGSVPLVFMKNRSQIWEMDDTGHHEVETTRARREYPADPQIHDTYQEDDLPF